MSSAPESAAPSALERWLRRDHALIVLGLFVLWALSTIYLLRGAGMGMSAWEMTRLTLLPQRGGFAPTPDMAGMAMQWSASYWLIVLAMWWTMMVAMMTPSAAPTVLLFSRVHRHAQAQGQLAANRAPIAAFVLGYFLIWLLFSLAATGLQWWLETRGYIAMMAMGSRMRWLSGAALLCAGVYQLSPLKNACLSQCRAPAHFLSQYWRPGGAGALQLGLRHGTFCLGCCWLLMLLLFVGGVMNLVWIAALTTLVLLEKLAPGGVWWGRVAGGALLVWGAVVFLQ